MSRTAKPIKHGTNYAYNTGCHCPVCRDAHNEYARRNGVNLRQGKRGDSKRLWDEENRSYCACGARCGRKYERCDNCRRRADREARDLRREDIAWLYRDGLPLREMAQQLHTTANSLGTELAHMRAEGWNLPHRNRGYDRNEEHQ